MNAKIYGYFSLIDKEGFTFHNKTTNEIKTFNIKKGDCLYIGVDTNGERHANHMKESKKHLQAVNVFIQENPELEAWVIKDLGEAASKELVHSMEMKLVSDFSPLMNIYGNEFKPNDTKLTLIDIDPDIMSDKQETSNGNKRFNTLEALAEWVDPSKMEMFTHKARYVKIIAAKDTGKSNPLDAYKLYCMERDPKASSITLMKYSTKASIKGLRSLSSMLGKLNALGFTFPQSYEPSTGFFYRLPKNKRTAKDLKTKLASQFIQYGSFEDSDDLASFTISNGGYPALIHIEEPVTQVDKNTPTRKEWNAQFKTIEDTLYRHYRDYNDSIRDANGELLPYKHAPIPFKIFMTLNDWDPDHPLSVEGQLYFPRERFMNWTLGFNYSKILALWKDKIKDAETVVPELKEWVDEKWDVIKKNLVKNHTGFVYIEKDINGKYVDTLYGRMTKFGNPQNRNTRKGENGELSQQDITLNEMYMALITGDSHELARTFGMGYDGTGGDDKRFNFQSFQPIDTIKKLNEPDRKLMGFTVAWDHDANRGPVATPTTMSGMEVNYGNPMQPLWGWKDVKVMIHPQVAIEGYGKGVGGRNTRKYHEQMVAITKELYDKYVKDKRRTLEMGKFAVFDDDDGSYIGHILDDIMEIGFDHADALPTKNGTLDPANGKYGFSVKVRDSIWQGSVDIEELLIDEKNVQLVTWLKTVPGISDASGDLKRSMKGKWGKRYKDISNSGEYSLFHWRVPLHFGLHRYENDYKDGRLYNY